jgi:hypothetical protein
LDASDDFPVLDDAAFPVAIDELATAELSGNSGCIVVNIPKARRPRTGHVLADTLMLRHTSATAQLVPAQTE